MKFLTVVDNQTGTSFDATKAVKRVDSPAQHFLAEHGLSLIIETDAGKRILFDTGASEMVFRHNLALLGVQPLDIDLVFISHGHYDHVGGLGAMIEAGVPIYTHPSTFNTRKFALLPDGNKREVSAREDLRALLPKAKLNFVSTPTEISPGVKVSGEVPRVFPFETESKFFKEENGQLVPDGMIEEQALFITSKRGLIIVTGCGHPGITNMAQLAKKQFDKHLYMIIGGFHLSGSAASNERILKTMENLKNLGVERIAPMHCAGFNATKMISDRFVNMDIMTSGGQLEIL